MPTALKTFCLIFAISDVAIAAEASKIGTGEIPPPEQTDLLVNGQHGYAYRIPALVVTPNGTVLAFCEGRKGSDFGDTDLVLKRSFGGGKTWQPLQVVWQDDHNTIANPCPVIDRTNGAIWLPFTRSLGTTHDGNAVLEEFVAGNARGGREVWIMKSADDGATWSNPTDISASARKANWRLDALGPGCGIQLSSGRLLVPCYHTVIPEQTWISHTLYSDDHGETWQIGNDVGPNTDECQVVELVDGRVMLNARSYAGKNCRAVAVSEDQGGTWSEVRLDPTLIEPVCQASFLRYTTAREFTKDRLLFANPASTTSREKLTIRMSYDEGQSWPVAKMLCLGYSGYSSLAVLPDMTVCCLFETASAT